MLTYIFLCIIYYRKLANIRATQYARITDFCSVCNAVIENLFAFVNEFLNIMRKPTSYKLYLHNYYNAIK